MFLKLVPGSGLSAFPSTGLLFFSGEQNSLAPKELSLKPTLQCQVWTGNMAACSSYICACAAVPDS